MKCGVEWWDVERWECDALERQLVEILQQFELYILLSILMLNINRELSKEATDFTWVFCHRDVTKMTKNKTKGRFMRELSSFQGNPNC